MATTINEAFNKLQQNLNITDLQTETVSTRQNSVREACENGLDLLDSFLSGSYSRSTMIAPLGEADIDIFIILESKYFYDYDEGKNGGQAGLLDLVKRTLRKKYTKTPDISRNGQAVTIVFEDFKVDVVPAFNRKNGGFLMPNANTQSWISTNPKTHVRLSSEANSAHDGDYVPLVKMIKGWNKENGEYFHSFHLEVLALSILDDVNITNFSSGIRYYFDKGKTLISKKNPDPAGYDGDVGHYLNNQEKINKAVSIFEKGYDYAIKAENAERNDFTEIAFSYWSKIFGDYFPAYG